VQLVVIQLAIWVINVLLVAVEVVVRLSLHNPSGQPKQLARILRFRHVVVRLRGGENDMTELALD
jgi:hypothetical protein